MSRLPDEAKSVPAAPAEEPPRPPSSHPRRAPGRGEGPGQASLAPAVDAPAADASHVGAGTRSSGSRFLAVSRALPPSKPSARGADVRRCSGLTRRGRQCGITSLSTLRSDSGGLVGAPLRNGEAYCVFHGGSDPDLPVDPGVLPLVAPSAAPEGSEILGGREKNSARRVVFFDLETVRLADDPEARREEPADSATRAARPSLGVDVRFERVVEFGAVCADTGAEFQALVWPGGRFPEPHVTGLTNQEVWAGHQGDFANVFKRFAEFVFGSVTRGAAPPRTPDQASAGCEVLLVAHNGHRFDVQVLHRECRRHGVRPDSSLGAWWFCDSLELASVLLADGGGGLTHATGCKKLQCLARDLGCAPAAADAVRTQPHRALADAKTLAGVVRQLIARAGGSFSLLWALARAPQVPRSSYVAQESFQSLGDAFRTRGLAKPEQVGPPAASGSSAAASKSPQRSSPPPDLKSNSPSGYCRGPGPSQNSETPAIMAAAPGASPGQTTPSAGFASSWRSGGATVETPTALPALDAPAASSSGRQGRHDGPVNAGPGPNSAAALPGAAATTPCSPALSAAGPSEEREMEMPGHKRPRDNPSSPAADTAASWMGVLCLPDGTAPPEKSLAKRPRQG